MSDLRVHRRIAGLDGLRAIAVMLVLIGHYTAAMFPSHAALFEKLFPGMLGVTLFFVISGFLISTLLLQEFEKYNTVSLANFYMRRLLRLAPALYVYVLITMIAYLIADGRVAIMEFGSAISYTANYYQIFTKTNLYYMPVWSLAIEEHFYLLFPLALLLCLKSGLDRLTWFVAGSIVVAFFWRMHVASVPGVDWHHVYWRTDTRLDSILFGVLLACLMASSRAEGVRRVIGSQWSVVAAVAIMALSVYYRNEFFRMSARYSVQGLSLMMLLGVIVYSPGWIATTVRRVLDLSPMQFLSKISYSLYLWHLTILKFVQHVAGPVGVRGGLLCLAGSFITATLSFHFVETPFLGLRRKFGSHAPKSGEPLVESHQAEALDVERGQALA